MRWGIFFINLLHLPTPLLQYVTHEAKLLFLGLCIVNARELPFGFINLCVQFYFFMSCLLFPQSFIFLEACCTPFALGKSWSIAEDRFALQPRSTTNSRISHTIYHPLCLLQSGQGHVKGTNNPDSSSEDNMRWVLSSEGLIQKVSGSLINLECRWIDVCNEFL